MQQKRYLLVVWGMWKRMDPPNVFDD